MGGAEKEGEAGGVREGDGGRGVQRHHMGRGGGSLLPRDWAGEGCDGEAVAGAVGEGHHQHRPLFRAPRLGLLPPPRLCRRSRRHPRYGVFPEEPPLSEFFYLASFHSSLVYFICEGRSYQCLLILMKLESLKLLIISFIE